MKAVARNWTEDETQRAISLWRQNIPSPKIAEAMGPGFTKNSVICRINRVKAERGLHDLSRARHRLDHETGLVLAPRGPRPKKPRPAAPKPKPEPARVAAPPAARRAVPAVTCDEPDAYAIRLGDTRTAMAECRWLYPGDAKGLDNLCCGRPTKLSSSYCEAHHARVYNTATDRRPMTWLR